MTIRKVFCLMAVVVLVGCRLAYAGSGTWQIGLDFNYTSGDYGTGNDTDITYVPVTIRRYFPKGDLSLIIPYISIKSTKEVTIVGGNPNKIRQTSRTTRKTEDGLGDILVQGRYYVLEETDTLPLVGITGNIKLPTADEHKELGTGELDAGFGFEFSKNFSDSWQAYFDIGYTFVGDPPGTDLRNQWYFDIGAGYYLAPELLVSAYYEESRALVAGEDNPRDLFFALNYDFSSEIEFTAGLLLGLSDGAPDYGFTGGIRFRF